jgi:hypothetical protein
MVGVSPGIGDNRECLERRVLGAPYSDDGHRSKAGGTATKDGAGPVAYWLGAPAQLSLLCEAIQMVESVVYSQCCISRVCAGQPAWGMRPMQGKMTAKGVSPGRMPAAGVAGSADKHAHCEDKLWTIAVAGGAVAAAGWRWSVLE